MPIEFDSAKDAINLAKHGISLARAVDLEIVAFLEDSRGEHGEIRYRAGGTIDGVHYCLAFTHRAEGWQSRIDEVLKRTLPAK